MSKRIKIGMAMMALVIFGACKKDAATPQTSIRLVHAAADLGTVDTRINNELFIGNISYGSPTSYQNTNAGSVTINIVPTGSTTGGYTVNGNFQSGKYYSVFAYDSAVRIKVSALEDNQANPPAGKSYVRFLHLVPNEGAVDIIKAGGPTILFNNRAFNDFSTNASLAGYTAVDPGPFSCAAIVAGSVNTLITQLPSFDATAGKRYTLVLRGFKGAVPLSDQTIKLVPVEDK